MHCTFHPIALDLRYHERWPRGPVIEYFCHHYHPMHIVYSPNVSGWSRSYRAVPSRFLIYFNSDARSTGVHAKARMHEVGRSVGRTPPGRRRRLGVSASASASSRRRVPSWRDDERRRLSTTRDAAHRDDDDYRRRRLSTIDDDAHRRPGTTTRDDDDDDDVAPRVGLSILSRRRWCIRAKASRATWGKARKG